MNKYKITGRDLIGNKVNEIVHAEDQRQSIEKLKQRQKSRKFLYLKSEQL